MNYYYKWILIVLERENKENKVKMSAIGNIEGKNILIIDDIADTCGTLLAASQILKKKGSKQIIAGIVHALTPKTMIEKLKESNISTLFFTNSMPYNTMEENSIKIIEIDISGHLSKCIQLMHSAFLGPRIPNGGK